MARGGRTGPGFGRTQSSGAATWVSTSFQNENSLLVHWLTWYNTAVMTNHRHVATQKNQQMTTTKMVNEYCFTVESVDFVSDEFFYCLFISWWRWWEKLVKLVCLAEEGPHPSSNRFENYIVLLNSKRSSKIIIVHIVLSQVNTCVHLT